MSRLNAITRPPACLHCASPQSGLNVAYIIYICCFWPGPLWDHGHCFRTVGNPSSLPLQIFVDIFSFDAQILQWVRWTRILCTVCSNKIHYCIVELWENGEKLQWYMVGVSSYRGLQSRFINSSSVHITYLINMLRGFFVCEYHHKYCMDSLLIRYKNILGKTSLPN